MEMKTIAWIRAVLSQALLTGALTLISLWPVCSFMQQNSIYI